MSFGQRLKQLREENHLTLEELSKKLNIGRSTISNYERDYRRPDINTIKHISDFFDVTVDYLLGKTDMRNYKVSKKEQMADEIIQVLIEKKLIEKDEKLTDEKREWLLELLKKAIEMSEM